jgi:hypoxanthine phosphoribosyltransferase
MELEFEAPSWDQIYNMLLNLAEKIAKSKFKPDIIVGVSRGGWAPARVLSDLLSNPNLASVSVKFYVGITEKKAEPTLTQPASVSVAGQRVLVVDEVVDTGKSLKLVKEHIIEQGAKEVKIVAVYCKPWSILKPDYYEKETSGWIVFPWEIKETVQKIIKACSGKSREEEFEKLARAGVPSELVKIFAKETLEEEKC